MTAALVALALSAVSSSKIGVVVLGDDATSQQLVAACPAVVVAPLAVGRTFGTALTTYRASCAGGTVVAQVGGQALVTVGSASPAVDAVNLWNNTWLLQVNALGVTPDWVEGPRSLAYPDTANLALFWSALADAVNGSGFRPIVGGLGPGNPASDFCPTATAMKAKGYVWGWSWLARTGTFTTDPVAELPTTLGYRAARTACTLAGANVFLTEAGPSAASWPAGDVSWLTWLDGQLATDADVRTAAAYQAGGGAGFSLQPLAAALATYLANPQPPDGGTPDGGADAGGGSGGAFGGGGLGGPGGPPGSGPKTGCASAGAGLTLLALLPLLALLRRRRHGVKR